MLIAFLIILMLTILTVMIHLEGLWAIRRNTKRLLKWPRLGLSLIVILSIQLHVIEIACFAIAYFLADHFLDVGHFTAAPLAGFFDWFYFSAETFTALGYGDITTTDSLRIVAVSEPLVGLTLISWSGAYTFIAMQRFWDETRLSRQEKRAAAVAAAARAPALVPQRLPPKAAPAQRAGTAD
jgi:hypothetical protein